MSEYEKLREEFNEKVKQLRENCTHPELSDWVEEWWAIGHSTGFKVQYCKVCGATIHRATTCWICKTPIQDDEIYNGNGTDALPYGIRVCKKCYDEKKLKKNGSNRKKAF